MRGSRTVATGCLVVGVALGLMASVASATSIGTVLATNDRIAGDLSDVSSAAQNSDLAGVEVGCQALQDDIEETFAFSRPRVVPKSAWRYINRGYSTYYNAGVLCESGARDGDAGAIRSATALMTKGEGYINRATSIIAASS